jgi:toxin ParE1/3/4
MRLRFTPRAIANLTEIGNYIQVQNLILFPHVGRKQKVEGVRKLVTRKYAYLVYYTVDEVAEEIVILNVKHPARRREHEDA